MVFQQRTIGSEVPFTAARELDLQYRTYQGDVFGVYALQNVQANIPASVRDAFLNGNLSDIQAQAAGQGMTVQYILVTWNETQQGNGYLITDCVVGIVATVDRDYNTGPAYLMDCAKAIPWFDDFIGRMDVSWKAWLLMSAPQYTSGTENVKSWTSETVSGEWGLSAPITEPIPDPPSTSEVRQHFVDDGNVAGALGGFVQEFLDRGYSITLLGYTVWICYERRYYRQPTGYVHGYIYRTHARLTVDFVSDAPIWQEEEQLGARRLFPVITTWMAIAIGVAVAAVIAGCGVYQFLVNMSRQEEVTEEWGWVQNPDTGEWEWVITSSEKKTGPPDWWGYVVPIMALIAVGGAIYFLMPLRPRRRESK